MIESFLVQLFPGRPARSTPSSRAPSCSRPSPRGAAWRRKDFAPSACWALRRRLPHRDGPGGDGVSCDHPRGAASVCVRSWRAATRSASWSWSARGRRPRRGQRSPDPAARRRSLARPRQPSPARVAPAPLGARSADRPLQPPLPGGDAGARGPPRRPRGPVAGDALARSRSLQAAQRHARPPGRRRDARAVGALLARSIRAGDVACRFGGEEFVVLLPGATLEGATRRAEHIRVELAQLAVSYRGEPLTAITASIGVAALPELCASATSLLRAADTAAYRAKREGRDRIAVADRSSAERGRSRSGRRASASERVTGVGHIVDRVPAHVRRAPVLSIVGVRAHRASLFRFRPLNT